MPMERREVLGCAVSFTSIGSSGLYTHMCMYVHMCLCVCEAVLLSLAQEAAAVACE